jgi:hypothetical protein
VLSHKKKKDSLPRKNISAGLGRWRWGVPHQKEKDIACQEKYIPVWEHSVPHQKDKDIAYQDK